MARINYYECCRCGMITRQIEISQRELSAMQGDPLLVQALFAINDLDGITSLCRETGVLRPYKCTKCGRVSNRSYSGDDTGYFAG